MHRLPTLWLDFVLYLLRPPLWQVENPTLRKAAKLAAAYSHALQPRLLVMVALAALVAGLNKVLDPPLDLLHQVREAGTGRSCCKPAADMYASLVMVSNCVRSVHARQG
jgi:hypothetical protein